MGGMVAFEIYTAKDAAQKLGCSIATVSRWASRLGMTAKHGPSLSLTEEDVQVIEQHRHAKAGNPNFGKAADAK
jgi:transposase